MQNNNDETKKQYIAEASAILSRVYEDYKDKGVQAIYLWGSVTRDDWRADVSDIDAIAIVNKTVNLDERPLINQRLKDEFTPSLKLGLQFFGIEELNGGEPYTLLSKFQPAGYLLLRFNDWLYVAGEHYSRTDFAVKDFTSAEARAHQHNQALRALKIVSGELPIDDGRHGLQSMVEDVVKGAIGALYWEAVEAGFTGSLNYDSLTDIVPDERKDLAASLIKVRATNSYTPETILPLRAQIEALKEIKQ